MCRKEGSRCVGRKVEMGCVENWWVCGEKEVCGKQGSGWEARKCVRRKEVCGKEVSAKCVGRQEVCGRKEVCGKEGSL